MFGGFSGMAAKCCHTILIMLSQNEKPTLPIPKSTPRPQDNTTEDSLGLRMHSDKICQYIFSASLNFQLQQAAAFMRNGSVTLLYLLLITGQASVECRIIFSYLELLKPIGWHLSWMVWPYAGCSSSVPPNTISSDTTYHPIAILHLIKGRSVVA